MPRGAPVCNSIFLSMTAIPPRRCDSLLSLASCQCPQLRREYSWLSLELHNFYIARFKTARLGGGGATVRAALYMAALVASRCNPKIREFHRRLRAAGKAPKVALVACMRKLLTILNAMIKHRVRWSPVVEVH
jgi:hypothetical protein